MRSKVPSDNGLGEPWLYFAILLHRSLIMKMRLDNEEVSDKIIKKFIMMIMMKVKNST